MTRQADAAQPAMRVHTTCIACKAVQAWSEPWLPLPGMQEGEQARTKGNSFLIDAMAAAADFPGLLDASGRAITGPYKVLGAHLACILALLKAKCPMSKKQYEAMLVGLYAYTHTKQPDSCPYREVCASPLHYLL